jgi:flagellar hook-associated protein FlgK
MTSLWAKDYDPQDVDTYYKMRTEVDKANDTYNTLKKLGKPEEAREYKQEHRTELKGGVKTQLNKMVSKIDTINEKIRKLAEIPNERMSPEAKRARRDQLDAKIRHIQSGVERLQKKVHPE